MKKQMGLLLTLTLSVLTACAAPGADRSISSATGGAAASVSAGTAQSETADQQMAKQVVTDFFVAAEQEDYETMKSYCMKGYGAKYIHEKGQTKSWFGFKNATLQTVELFTGAWDSIQTALVPDGTSGYFIDVTFQGETVPTSSLWTEEEPVQTYSCYFLVQQEGGDWKIAGMEAS